MHLSLVLWWWIKKKGAGEWVDVEKRGGIKGPIRTVGPFAILCFSLIWLFFVRKNERGREGGRRGIEIGDVRAKEAAFLFSFHLLPFRLLPSLFLEMRFTTTTHQSLEILDERILWLRLVEERVGDEREERGGG